MLPTEHLLAFVVIATVLIVVPGPSVLFVVTRSLTLGRVPGSPRRPETPPASMSR